MNKIPAIYKNVFVIKCCEMAEMFNVYIKLNLNNAYIYF